MDWRLGLDVGTNSIGWSALELGNGKPVKIVDAGVRIFSDGRNPKDGASLATKRRVPRSARRNRDRYLVRRDTFMERLIEHGLMPADPEARKSLEALDPWILRAKGLDEALSLHEFGRALFHLQQRRGFKSNRKTDRADSEKGAIAEATQRTLEKLDEHGARTIGELFGGRRAEAAETNRRAAKGMRVPQPSARVSPYFEAGKIAYDYYPTRDLVQREFDLLWEAQAKWHGEATLGSAAREALADVLFFQRPLRPQPVGKCSLDPTQERAPRALPSVQRLRIYQEANHLAILTPGSPARSLTREERDKVVEKLLGSAKVSFSSLRRTLGLDGDCRFNLESEKRQHLIGDETAAELSKEKRWGKTWRDLSLTDQTRIVHRLIDEEDEAALEKWLRDAFGLDADRAASVSDAPLPEGHAALCEAASEKVLKALAENVVTYDKAVSEAGYLSHSRLDHHGEILDRLPYYGSVLERHVAFGSGDPDDPAEKRFGKVANPTVHVALNQIRKVVNDLIARFGPPREIVVELARDLPLSAQGRRDLERRQRDNQKANEARSEELAKLGIPDTYENRMRLRLWEELNPGDPLDRRCPFTGEQIGIDRLFSDEVEIEHILPKSRTLDDSPANKTLCMRAANRVKREKTPFEAFGHSPAGFDWDSIAERAASMPSNKAWRFSPDAMDRYTDGDRDFLARQLGSTQYIARLTANYLVWIVGDPAKVHVIPGKLTSDLRHYWGLNSVLRGHNRESSEADDVRKNRNDHRHHAIDAIVVALTDRALLRQVATEAARDTGTAQGKLIDALEPPWDGFRDEVAEIVRGICVSHKPDHGIQGALHNDTAYGIATPAGADGKNEVVHRVPLSSLDSPAKLDLIRDDVIRERLRKAGEGLTGKALIEAVETEGASMTPPVRKVRIVEKLNVIPIKDKTGRLYKAYKGDSNYCYDIFEDKNGRWRGEIVSRFDANQPDFDPDGKTTTDGTPLIMRLRGNDLILIREAGASPRLMRVVKMTRGQIFLADHFEAGALKARDADKEDEFKYLSVSPGRLQTLEAERAYISPSGRLFC